MTTDLAQRLREGTKKSHTMAENVGFVKCFLKGVVDKQAYGRLVGNLYFVYSAMEEALLQHQSHPVVGPIVFPELHRRASLEKDLVFYFGPHWRESLAPSPAGRAYVARIQALAATQPELLVAHSYTRYLGDLSGGQILKKIAQRAMNLEGEGTAFYEFEQISDEKAFKVHYRQTLDSLPLDEATIETIVEEANDAFRMNMAMFQELNGNLIKAIGQMLFNSLTRSRSRGSTEAELAAAD